jgi:hypothetical protein
VDEERLEGVFRGVLPEFDEIAVHGLSPPRKCGENTTRRLMGDL